MPAGYNTLQGLKNIYVDFASTPTYNLNATFSVENNEFALGYDIYTLNGVNYTTPKRIDQNGNITNTAYSWIKNYSGTQAYLVAFTRQITGIGIQNDMLTAYYSTTTDQNSPSVPVQGLDEQIISNISYLILQKSVPVTKFTDDLNNTVTLANNSSLSITTGVTYTFDKNLNRGDESSSTWVIYKTDPEGSFQQQIAIAGTDYTITVGSLTSDIMSIQFLTPYNFEVHNKCSGYTFSNNPYATYSDTTTNQGINVHYFTTTASVYYYDITFPKISIQLSVPSDVLVDTAPFTTYSGQQITVNSLLDLATGSWIRKTTNNSVPDLVITKTDAEWRTEILNRCNVTLEIRNTLSNILTQSQNGLGPYTFSVSDPNSYTAKFKLVLK